MNPHVSAGFVRARPLIRLTKIRSGTFAPEYLWNDGKYHSEPMPKGSALRGITHYERLITEAERFDG